jgi:hypothetical protein
MDMEQHGGMHMPGMHGPGDRPAFHGMLVFGSESAYLSHLPMFSAPPHRYQLIMGVALTKGGADQLPAIVADRERTGSRMYSFTPTRNFVLTDLVTPDPEHPRLDSFPGTLVRGHFEPGHFEPQGEELVPGVVARVEHVFEFDKFADRPEALPELQYFLFGRAGERFLAHVLTGPPDFDQVIGVRVTDHEFSDQDLARALRISLAARANQPERRLKEGEQVEGTVQVTGQQDQVPLTVRLELGKECYFETADLAEGLGA